MCGRDPHGKQTEAWAVLILILNPRCFALTSPTHVDNMMTASATDRRCEMSSAHFHLEVAAVRGALTKMSLISRCNSPEAPFDWLSHFLYDGNGGRS